MSLETTGQHRAASGTLRYCRHASSATEHRHAVLAVPARGERPVPVAAVAVGPDLHRRELHHQGRRLPACFAAGTRGARARYHLRGAKASPTMRRMTWVRAHPSTWMPPKPPGRRTSRWSVTSPPSCCRWWRASSRWTCGRCGISGHSMGGHGALTLALRHPQLFRSVSAFSPISSPTRCPWGQKALGAYLGPDESHWREHDASLLIEARRRARPFRPDPRGPGRRRQFPGGPAQARAARSGLRQGRPGTAAAAPAKAMTIPTSS